MAAAAGGAMLTLAQPVWLALLPLLLLGAALAGRRRVRMADAGQQAGLLLVHPNLAPLPADQDYARSDRRVHAWLNGGGAALLVLALAQPQWIGDWIPEAPEGREIAILIDTSKTMSINDFEMDGKPVERITVLKSLVNRFVEGRRGDRLGVIAFGTTAATLVPPTFDRKLVTEMIRRAQVGIAGDDTAIGDAIGLALKQLQQGARLRPALILFTDGDNTAGEITPAEAVTLARGMGVPVYAVQVGVDIFDRPQPARPAAAAEQPGLREMAARTGGRYYEAGDSGALQTVIADIGRREQTVHRPATRRAVLEWYWVPLLLGVFLFTASSVRMMLRSC